jgi:hypothetical protein
MNCDDKNPCTQDTCYQGQCNYTVIPCDLCLFINCNTTDLCAPEQCDLVSGTCNTSVINCDDANVCTTDSCGVVDGKATCSHAAVPCEPSDSCHEAKCDSKLGCLITMKNCDDSNSCTTDTCVAGECVHDVVSFYTNSNNNYNIGEL